MFVVEKHANESAAFTSLAIFTTFDVFRLDGLLNPQVLVLEMFQTSRAMLGAAWTCMRKRPMREPEDLPTFDLAFHAERSPVPACGSSHTLSCTTLLLRCLTRSLVAVCTNVEPDDGRLAAFLRCAIFEFGLRSPSQNP